MRAEIEQLIQARRWALARVAYDKLLADLALVAAAAPTGGWEATEQAIRAGLAQDADAEEAKLEAETALRQGQPWAAVDLLSRFVISELPVATALPLIRVRETALQQLLALGQGSETALTTVRAQREALEQALESEWVAIQSGRSA
jgi:pilus assembly protein CpaF